MSTEPVLILKGLEDVKMGTEVGRFRPSRDLSHGTADERSKLTANRRIAENGGTGRGWRRTIKNWVSTKYSTCQGKIEAKRVEGSHKRGGTRRRAVWRGARQNPQPLKAKAAAPGVRRSDRRSWFAQKPWRGYFYECLRALFLLHLIAVLLVCFDMTRNCGRFVSDLQTGF